MLIQKALELAAKSRALGAALLSAIEKGDAEQLALLRQGHEIQLQKMMQNVRFLQWHQAQEATSRCCDRGRRAGALHLLSAAAWAAPDADAVPASSASIAANSTEDKFDEAYNGSRRANTTSRSTLQPYAQLQLAGARRPRNPVRRHRDRNIYLYKNEGAS